MEQLPGTVPLYTAEEMRTLDRITVEHVGIPGVVLMERAGMAAAAEILAAYPGAVNIAVVCGPGNNGGDGFVVARHLAAAGRRPQILLVETESKLRRESKTNFAVAQQLNIPTQRVSVTKWKRILGEVDLVVDALLGTGASGPPKPPTQAAIDAIHSTGVPVVSIDVPSGIDASTGEAPAGALQAQLTVTFHGPKIGLAVAPGRFYAGRVRVADIGIPPSVESSPEGSIATRALLRLLPGVERSGNKYSSGSVLVIGGSTGMSGAPMLSARAALRCGAGIVRLVAPSSVAAILDGTTSELLVRGAAEDAEGRFGAGAHDAIDAELDAADAVVIGPGMGRSEDLTELVRHVATRAAALVIDADALAAFAGATELLLAREGRPTIITPHEGELGRLLNQPSQVIRERRLFWARQAALQTRSVVVLKGEDTLIVRPNGEFLVATSHKAAATAGSGDVLAGAVAAMVAHPQNDARIAAAFAAVAAGEAAMLATRQVGEERGVTASDILEQLPHALGRADVPIDFTLPLELDA